MNQPFVSVLYATYAKAEGGVNPALLWRGGGEQLEDRIWWISA